MASLPQFLPPLQGQFLSTGTGSSGGGILGGILSSIPVVGGLISSIIGGGPDTPTEQSQFISVLRSFFPDQNQTVCGAPFDLSSLNGGSPLWMNISCSDPNFGNATESTLEWWIKLYGLGSFLSVLSSYLSTSPGGQAGTGGAVSGTSPTSGLDAGLSNLTNVLTGVAGAITGAIDAQTSTATAGVGAAVGAIQHTLDVFTGGLTNLQSTIGGTIVSGIGSVLDSLFNPSGSVIGAIEAAINGLATEQTSVFGTILGSIERDIAAAEQGFLGLGISLADILKNLWKQLPTILVQVLGAEIPGLKDIVHAIEVLTGHLPGSAKTSIDWSDFGDILGRVMKAAEDIAGVATRNVNVVFQPSESLSPSCSLEETLQKLDAKQKGLGQLPDWAVHAMNATVAVIVELIRAVPIIQQFDRLAEEVQNKTCPITKLGVSDVINALSRGYVTDADAREELLLQGIGANRFNVLRDLSHYLENPSIAIDQWWRDILSDEDLATLLKQNGFSDAQIDAAKKASFQITPLQEANDAFNRGLITDDQYGIIATANHLDDVQVDLARLLRQRPPNPVEALNGQLVRDALGNLSIPFFTDWDTVPDFLATAGHAAGLNDDAIKRIWWSHFNVGNIGSWITSYFRGRRLYPELSSIATSFGIPETYLADLVDISRPLIPFRTIPAMIAAGIIDEEQGHKILAKHGFDSGDIDLLIKYAQRGSKSSKADTAKNQHSVSLSTARTAYDDGILTKDQYMELLQAHGLDAQAAITEIQVADLSNEIKARKQLSTDVVNEYNAGLLDQQGAIQQLASAGLTVAEQAAAVRKMKSGQAVKGKQPSEPELRAWAKADIITTDEYQSRLQTIGWSIADSQHFRDQHFPAA